ncbi:sodium:proton antiporter [Acidobacteria bacterium AH-259-D05]|nr:sodium:proton antiporter [Acidobacteria bacterium AH-259-D05]
MSLFDILAVLITLSALFSYLNFRYFGLPTTIGLMLIALLMSLALILAGQFGLGLEQQVRVLLSSIDFNQTLLHGMLSFLLFAGALHLNLSDLAKQKWIIGALATFGVIGSTVLVGTLTWLVFVLLEFEIPLIYCLLFGALISPTDPIAVLSILKTANIPKSLETKIAGESLFNDGVGVVVFLVLMEIVTGGQEFSVRHVVSLFFIETGGGVLFGLAIGFVAYRMLKSVDNYQVEILITLALVTGGYALANRLHISGPIAIVVAGLLIGNHGRLLAMSQVTCEHLDTFWELVDEILNAVLFVLIGLEILVLPMSVQSLLVGLAAIPLVLMARLVSVGVPVLILRPFRQFSPRVVRILTWGGLRGGISVALALSLPTGTERDLLLPVTYAVVVFSVLVQGLTIGKLVRS